MNGEKLDIPWSDIPYLRLRYVSRVLLDGMGRKVIPADDVANNVTTKEDVARKNDDDKAETVADTLGRQTLLRGRETLLWRL